jgi:peptidoglycan hydrolase-like protein with peptidoglycan-binding domain
MEQDPRAGVEEEQSSVAPADPDVASSSDAEDLKQREAEAARQREAQAAAARKTEADAAAADAAAARELDAYAALARQQDAGQAAQGQDTEESIRQRDAMLAAIGPPPGGALAQRQAIIDVQKGLASLRFYTGPADGIFSPATRAAIVAFQQSAGLEATGRMDDALVGRMRQVTAPSSARDIIQSLGR